MRKSSKIRSKTSDASQFTNTHAQQLLSKLFLTQQTSLKVLQSPPRSRLEAFPAQFGKLDLRIQFPQFVKKKKMSQVFEGYERQYCELSTNLSRKCDSVSTLLDAGEKELRVTEIKDGINEADALIRKMDLEARSLQPSLKAMLLAKLREYKADLNNLKREFKKVTSPGTVNPSARDELMESGMLDPHKASANQRERLAMSTERLNDSSDRIRESRRTVLETEELGVSILQDLHQQRQTLLHSHSKLHGVDEAIDKSKKVLSAMSRRMSRNKVIVGSVIAALILAIIIVLYFKLS